MPRSACLKTARSKANPEDAFPLYTLTQLPTISQRLRHLRAWKRYPDLHSLTWSSPLRICTASPIYTVTRYCSLWWSFTASLLALLLSFAPTGQDSCSFYIYLLQPFMFSAQLSQLFSLLLARTNRAQVLTIFHQWKPSGSSICIYQCPHPAFQLWFYCIFVQKVKAFMWTLVSCCLQSACSFGITAWHFWTEDENFLHLKFTALAEVHLNRSSMPPAVMYALPECTAFSHSQQGETPKQSKPEIRKLFLFLHGQERFKECFR